jgi:hypothetical protein
MIEEFPMDILSASDAGRGEQEEPVMSFFQRLVRLFSAPIPGGKFHRFRVRCRHCGEIIEGKIGLYYEPSLEFDEKGKACYVSRKVLIGSGRCFQPIEVIFKFDEPRRVLDRQVAGGEFIDE